MDKNEKKLILFMPSMEGGGVEKNLIIIANYLAKNIKNISLITFDKKFNNKFDKKINIINSNYSNKKKYSKYFKYFISICMLIKEISGYKQSLVFSFQANIYVIILSIFFNFKIITRSNSSPSGWGNNVIKKYLFKFFFKYAKEIVVNSHHFKKEFQNVFNVKTLLIYNPLDKSEIVKKSKKFLNFKFFDDAGSLKIINIARFTDQKDHITLLKSFEIVVREKKSKLLIMGYGNNKEIIDDFIKEKKLNDYIKVIDFQDNPYNYLNKADIFVLTSKFEGLPNVLLEAQVLKKFIISSDCPTGPKEILKSGKYGDLFEVGDYKNLAKQILKFNKKSKIYRSKIKLAYNSLDRFDYSKNCKKYLNIICKSL